MRIDCDVHPALPGTGALLPYLAEFSIEADAQAGMRTALLYLANILGSAAGSILTGVVLMDCIGLITVLRPILWLFLLMSRPPRKQLCRPLRQTYPMSKSKANMLPSSASWNNLANKASA